jgi:hypothetical protein
MRNRSKLLLTGLTTAFVLALSVGSVSANRLSTSAQDFDIRWTSAGFSSDSGSNASCPVTLQGSFHSRTMAKVANALIGFVSRASVRGQSSAGNCTGGTATVLQASLPWHLTYRSFSGTLPNISGVSINIINESFQLQPSGSLSCLGRTTAANPAIGIINIVAGRGASITADPAAEIPLTSEFGLCAFGGSGHFENTSSSLTRLASTASITVTLI